MARGLITDSFVRKQQWKGLQSINPFRIKGIQQAEKGAAWE